MPKLFNDLYNSKIDTLKNFAVSNHEKPIPALYIQALMKIINMISISTTASIKLRERIWFARWWKIKNHKSMKITYSRTLYSTNSINSELDLSRFGRKARVAKNRNRWFTAKTISNNAWKNSYMVSLASSCTNFE